MAEAHLGEFDAAKVLGGVALIRLSQFKQQTGEDGQPIEELQNIFPPTPPH